MGKAVSRARTIAKGARAAVVGQPPTPSWVRAEDNPDSPDPVDSPRLFAVLGTYNEEDVVEANVANAFTQGVERVYLVDNASTDDTVARAVGAGAELAEVFRTACSQESLRILIMNSVVWRVSSAESSEHVWWLWLDADEFPEGPEGQTIKQYLDGLDRRFRVVGSRYYQHFPDYKPEYIHERIAYSKLPEHTFRFRWEDGRVQFYDNGVGRFPLAATRKEPLALLTWDLGFWDRESGEAKLTDKGAAFIEEVLS